MTTIVFESNANLHASPSRKVKRVRTGCLTCRSRKVKCDEYPGVCCNCRHMEIACEWPGDQAHVKDATSESPTNQVSSTLQNNPELRLLSGRFSACYNCRYARSKCTKLRPACGRCSIMGLPCEYPPPRRRRKKSAVSSTIGPHSESQARGNSESIQSDISPSAATGSNARDSHRVDEREQARINPSIEETATGLRLPPIERLEELVYAYFRYVHEYQAIGFLHRASTIQSIHNGTGSRLVLLSICAVASPFVEPPETPETAQRWADSAMQELILENEMCIDNVRAAMILAAYMANAGFFHRAHKLSSLANVQALWLGLHTEPEPNDSSTFVEIEGRRRLFYACYCVERMISNGKPESIYCPADRIGARLPCESLNYQLGLPVETPEAILETDESAVPPSIYANVGILGFYARLVGIRFTIKRCFRAMSESPTTSPRPWEPTSAFSHCLVKLATFRQSLPPRLRLTPELIVNRHDEADLAPIIMLYLWWNMCYIEHFRTMVSGFYESLDTAFLLDAPHDWVHNAQTACLRHAQAITSILDFVYQNMPRHRPLVIHDHHLPYLIYSSIRIQLDLGHVDECSPPGKGHLREPFDMMLGFLSRAAIFFRPAQLALKHTRKLIARHGLYTMPERELHSRGDTPPHPWFKRQKIADDRRDSLIDSNSLSSDDNFLEVLNYFTDQGGQTWHTFDYSGNEPSTLNNLDGGNRIVGPSAYNIANVPEGWQGAEAAWFTPSPDQFLPDTSMAHL